MLGRAGKWVGVGDWSVGPSLVIMRCWAGWEAAAASLPPSSVQPGLTPPPGLPSRYSRDSFRPWARTLRAKTGARGPVGEERGRYGNRCLLEARPRPARDESGDPRPILRIVPPTTRPQPLPPRPLPPKARFASAQRTLSLPGVTAHSVADEESGEERLEGLAVDGDRAGRGGETRGPQRLGSSTSRRRHPPPLLPLLLRRQF